MKVKVLKPFCDKYTGKKYKTGDFLEVNEKRFNEIIMKGKYIELVEENKQVKS